MRFYNGVPITVVSGLQNMPTLGELSARRRAEEDARLEADAPKASKCRLQQTGNGTRR